MFDPAVRSRIHIMLYYAPPDDAMRRQLWGQKLEPYQHGFKGAIEESLSIIAEYEMNGREISNTVISAKTIADQKLEDMNIDHLQTVLQVWKASQLVASVKPPNNNRVILRKMAPWLLRLVMFTLFCGALRSSYVGIRKFKNKLVQFLSRSKC